MLFYSHWYGKTGRPYQIIMIEPAAVRAALNFTFFHKFHKILPFFHFFLYNLMYDILILNLLIANPSIINGTFLVSSSEVRGYRMIKRLITVLLFAAVSVTICTAQAQLRNFYQEGQASQDIITEELSAHHPSLPLGTQVKVTNPKNGKEVIVVITGRIPASEGRVVDISTGAGQGLGLPSDSRGPVILEVVDTRRTPPRPTVVPPPPPPPELEIEPEPEPEIEPEPEAEPEPEPELEPEIEPEPEAKPEPEPEEPPPPETPPEEPPPEEWHPKPEPEPVVEPEPEPQQPVINNSDSKTQTTAPVSAQSPTFNIYNVVQSPNSFATDSAPVNASSGGGQPSGAGDPGASGTTSHGGGIIAVAPSSSVSKQVIPPVVPAPAPGSKDPAVASASASIVAVQPPTRDVNIEATGPTMTVPPMPGTPAMPPAPAMPSISQTAPQTPPPPQQQQQPPPQQWQQQPRQPEPSPLPPPVDVGTAIIIPYMPHPGNGKNYRVQVGSFLNTYHAKEAFDRLTTLGFKPAYERYGDYIRVVIPGIRAADMPALARLIGRVGFREALIREEN
jgi:rare lipoprotein A (peptidoglycan hydrolase)